MTPKQNKTTNSITTEINSRLVSWWLTQIGMRRGSVNKVVPNCIMQAPREIVSSFLRGLFHDSCVNKTRWVFSSASKQVADFVSSTLLNAGIACVRGIDTSNGRAQGEGNPNYKVAVSGSSNIKLLLDFVVFNKKDLHAGLAILASKPHNPNLDVLYVPGLVDEMIAHSSREDRRGLAQAGAYSYRGASHDQAIGYAKLAQLVELASPSQARDRAARLIDRNIFWAPVYSVEDAGDQQVYDMTVPDGEAYVANGVLNHNTGKSAICEAVATALKLELAKGGISRSMNKYIGESESNMRATFEALKLMAPIVFWIDEFGRDTSGGSSSSETDSGTTNRVHGEFLTGLQELPEDILLMAAANRIGELPPEMTRADRFDKIMFVGFPSFAERRDIFRIHLTKRFVNMYNLDELAAATAMFTGAEIKSLVNEVKVEALTAKNRMPTTEEIVRYSPKIKGRIWFSHRDEIANLYTQAMSDWHWASTAQAREAKIVLASARSGNIDSSLTRLPDENMKAQVASLGGIGSSGSGIKNW